LLPKRFVYQKQALESHRAFRVDPKQRVSLRCENNLRHIFAERLLGWKRLLRSKTQGDLLPRAEFSIFEERDGDGDVAGETLRRFPPLRLNLLVVVVHMWPWREEIFLAIHARLDAVEIARTQIQVISARRSAVPGASGRLSVKDEADSVSV